MRVGDQNLPFIPLNSSTSASDVRQANPSIAGNLAAPAQPALAGDAFELQQRREFFGLPSRPEFQDVSAALALWGLNHTHGLINGDQMAAAIESGIADLDGQGAASEFSMFANWAQQNQHRLSPEARQVMDIYRQYAQSAQARGLSGIPDHEFRQMIQAMRSVHDASATAALSELDQTPGPINGDQMADTIRKGIGDLDNKSATDELKQFTDWAQKNQHRLSPEARQVMDIYKRYAESAQARGLSGIPQNEYQQMLRELNGVRDTGAAAVLDGLDRAPGPINGDQMAEAIRNGIADPDNKGATDEFKLFADWAQKNQHRLSPEARQVVDIYKRFAESAQGRGLSGIPQSEYQQMLREMDGVRDASASKALQRLSQSRGRVSGHQMLDAIRRGVGDRDGKAATDEFKLFADWAKQNPKKLSPEAKKVMAIYTKYAKAAQTRGQADIPLGEYRKMLREMAQAARPNIGASRKIVG